MGSTFSVLKSLTIPALIALLLYLLTTYLIYPLWLRHHTRYTSYIPLPNITITSTFRQRLQSTLTRILLPSSWRAQTALETYRQQEWDGDEESGEELEEVDEARRREALSLDARRGRNGNNGGESRLSRDLEEGFKDDSEDEDEEGREVIANLERMGMISISRR